MKCVSTTNAPDNATHERTLKPLNGFQSKISLIGSPEPTLNTAAPPFNDKKEDVIDIRKSKTKVLDP